MSFIVKPFFIFALLISLLQALQPLSERLELDYIGYGGGLINASGYDTGLSMTATTQKHLPQVDEHFALELDTGISLLAPSALGQDLQHLFIATYGTYDYQIDNKTLIKAKVGLIFQNLSTATSSTYDLGLSYGLQSLYTFEHKKSFYIDFTVLGRSLSLLSAGILFHY